MDVNDEINDSMHRDMMMPWINEGLAKATEARSEFENKDIDDDIDAMLLEQYILDATIAMFEAMKNGHAHMAYHYSKQVQDLRKRILFGDRQ